MQQRLKRTVERSTVSIEKNSKGSNCDTETSLPSPPKSPCSSLIAACDDSMGLHIQIKNVSKRTPFVQDTRYASFKISIPQIQPNRKHLRSQSSARMDQVRLYPATICPPQKASAKRTPTIHETLLSPLSKKHTTQLEHHRLKNELMLLLSGKNRMRSSEPTSTRVKKIMQYTYDTFINGLFKKPKKKSPKVIRQEFAIQCIAKSEFIAAGKLHYILSDVSLIIPHGEKYNEILMW